MFESPLFHNLMDASPDPLFALNDEGRIIGVNQATTSITGTTKDKLLTTQFSDYFKDPLRARQLYHDTLTKGCVSDVHITLRHSAGLLNELSFNGAVFKDKNGMVAGVVLVARAQTTTQSSLTFENEEKEKRAAELIIANKELAYQTAEKAKRAAELIIANKELAYQTDEKEKREDELVMANIELAYQNEEKEKIEITNKELEAFNTSIIQASQYARSLIEASLDPLFTVSPEGKITDMNNATANITGKTRQEMLGTDFFDYFTEPEKAREGYELIFANGSVADYPLTIRDHSLTDVLFNGSVYKDTQGNVLGVVVVARNITEQKLIEKELTEAKIFAEMATIIAEEAKDKAENATRLAVDSVKSKQQFLSNMSHEIRTPMNAIIGFTKVVLKTELTAKQKEYLTAIKISGDALIVLINDILDLAKVDAGKMVFEAVPFRMALSIAAMLHLFETKIQEKNLELIKIYDKRIPELLSGDPVRLHQIILNLVSNAVKFTATGSITVSVTLVEQNENEVTLEFAVTDTGIGISESKIDRIFENFQQATSGTSRLYGGTGLGLAIVKQLVEQQGGTITVTSTPDIGSRFSFRLNFSKTLTDAEAINEIIEPDTTAKSIKVLVVEDIPLNQLLMKTLLDDFGFERDIAGNGKIAIEKMENNNYDIILMDLQMPEMNGFEATAYIRTVMKSSIPIIALTADVTTVDLAKCKAVGMNDYIAKPVDEKLLYSKIVGLMKKPEMELHHEKGGKIKYKSIDLGYLNQRTKSNPELMSEMITLYIEQTPPLLDAMNESLASRNWPTLQATIHKMIPSFSIVGINPDFVEKAKKVHEYARAQQENDAITDLVQQIDNICTAACAELATELDLIKQSTL